MAKKYNSTGENPYVVSDASLAYSAIAGSQVTADNPMPCSFTDEEFKEELQLSEASGFVSNDDFKRSCLERWGVAL